MTDKTFNLENGIFMVDGEKSLTYGFELPLKNSIGRISSDNWRTISKNYWKDLGYDLVEDSDKSLIFEEDKSSNNTPSTNQKRFYKIIIQADFIDNKIIFIAELSKAKTEAYSIDANTNPEVLDLDILIKKIYEFKSILKSHTMQFEYKRNSSRYNFFSDICMIALATCFGVAMLVFGLYYIDKIIEYANGSSDHVKLAEIPSANAIRNREVLTDIYLMPFYGFDENLANRLAATLSKELKLNVRVTTVVPIPQGAFDPNREQYISEMFYEPMLRVKCGLYDTKPECVCIGLIKGSIFTPTASLRFMFAAQYQDGISVVGDSELNEYGRASKSLYQTRLYKIVKRSIGKSYYKYPPSSDKNSVMYSPLMSLSDLDSMGKSYH